MTPIDKLVSASVSCTRCGARGVGSCTCWEKCGCGWTKGRDENCGNPKCIRGSPSLVGAYIEWEYAHDHGRGTCLVRRGKVLRVVGRNVEVDTGGMSDWLHLDKMRNVRRVRVA